MTPIKTSLFLKKMLLDQADILAQRLNISQDQMFEMALEAFIRDHQTQSLSDNKANQDESAPDEPSDTSPKETAPHSSTGSVIRQGDVYWLQLESPDGLEPGIPHPHVIIQENVLNHSRLNTVVVCALTSNIKRINIPGTVLLEVGEANLPRQSLVETSKVSTVEKRQLGDYIGSLTQQRTAQILAAMRFLQTSFFER